jgi:trk system potassium uptake protein TrkH
MKKSVSILMIATFLSAIVIGSVLLMLPISTTSHSIKIEDAFFTATSAVTVTGLIVKDTPTNFTLFGKMVILTLIQFGGLGFMTFSTLIILLLGKSISLSDKFMIENVFTTGSYNNVNELIKKIFLLTLGFELTGAVFLFTQLQDLRLDQRILSSVFHSVSAFCNAGFSVFSNSFESYKSHIGINLILMTLIISGGIGFLVLNETSLLIRRKIKKMSRLSLHSKLDIITTLILIFSGFAIILIEEVINKKNVLPTGTKILTALFQSVTSRTAGFNTVNLNMFTTASVFILMVLMFIGASPGSTGGGVKTSSIGMFFAYLRSQFRGRENVDLFYRNIPSRTVDKAFMVMYLSLVLISISFILLLSFDKQFSMVQVLFEVISAFGTVGLSMGITSSLSLGSKIVIMMTMFIGRIGPLTLLVALSRKESRGVFQYPEENIMIG